MNIAIIYHDADFDGKLSNEVCRYHLHRIYPDSPIHSYGWDYGRPIPAPSWEIETHHAHNGGQTTRLATWEDYDLIYIVDLSVDDLMGRVELRDKIVWIDHHKSAIEKWKSPLLDGEQLDGVAACRLCWQWFIKPFHKKMPPKQDYIDRKVTEPELIRLAGEYDIWDNRDPDAKALQFGLRTLSEQDLNGLCGAQFWGFPDADLLLNQVIKSGYQIKSYCDIQNDEYSSNYATTLQWEGLTFCALNIGQRGNSDLLRGGLKPEHQACFAWRYDGKQVLVSLYHVEGHTDLDLSKIAVKYGGGGHRGACGFRIQLDTLNSILNKEETTIEKEFANLAHILEMKSGDKLMHVNGVAKMIACVLNGHTADSVVSKFELVS